MLHNGRRLSAARSWAHAREQFARVIAEGDALQHELDAVRTELARLHAEITELRSIMSDVVVGLRQEADRDVAALRAKLQAALLRLGRNNQRPLH
jgi:chromosome segregation ATPase